MSTPTAPPPISPVLRAIRALVGAGFRFTARLRRHAAGSVFTCTPPSPGETPLVLLLPGYYGQLDEFTWFYPALQQALGATCTVAVVDTLDPELGTTPEEPVDQLVDYLTRHGAVGRPLYLVGHSLGGIVARCFTHHPTGAAVRGVVMLGSPNGGVNIWNLLPIHWMRSRGFAARINARFPLTPGIRYLAIAGTKGHDAIEGFPNDRVVGAWSVLHLAQLARPDITHEEHRLPLDHWELLRDPTVRDLVVSFITAAE